MKGTEGAGRQQPPALLRRAQTALDPLSFQLGEISSSIISGNLFNPGCVNGAATERSSVPQCDQLAESLALIAPRRGQWGKILKPFCTRRSRREVESSSWLLQRQQLYSAWLTCCSEVSDVKQHSALRFGLLSCRTVCVC